VTVPVRVGTRGGPETAVLEPPPRSGRLALVGWASGFVFSGAVGGLLFCLALVGIVLFPVVLGGLLLLAAVPMIRGLARWQRQWAGRMLGREVPAPYHSLPERRGRRLLNAYAADVASWRDLSWLPVALVVGTLTSAVFLGLLAAAVFFAIYPWLWSVTPPGTFAANFGFFTVHDQRSAFYPLVLGAAVFAVWFAVGPTVMKARARVDEALLAPTESAALRVRVQELHESRAQAVDSQAAELRRIERDLHDGAQARLVALAMTLGMAEEVIARDPDAARTMIGEARSSTTEALAELRALVRGIHPPLLADRGLDGAVRALALAMSLPVQVELAIPHRLPAPVESAAYFCVAEVLTNVAKHSRAASARVVARYRDDLLVVEVVDTGVGGADERRGTGLRGIAKRLSAFDGSLAVLSPAGGPTVVHMEVPCALS
jgi:signal transduction histidine kinase